MCGKPQAVRCTWYTGPSSSWRQKVWLEGDGVVRFIVNVVPVNNHGPAASSTPLPPPPRLSHGSSPRHAELGAKITGNAALPLERTNQTSSRRSTRVRLKEFLGPEDFVLSAVTASAADSAVEDDRVVRLSRCIPPAPHWQSTSVRFPRQGCGRLVKGGIHGSCISSGNPSRTILMAVFSQALWFPSAYPIIPIQHGSATSRSYS